MMKEFTVSLEDDEVEAVKRLIKSADIHSLLSSYETSVNYGILHQILEQEQKEEE